MPPYTSFQGLPQSIAPTNDGTQAWWARLLNDIPLTTFTIMCAPHVFAELASISIISVDSWAFNMPYQIIRFRQDEMAARRRVDLNNLPNLLTARPWTEFSVNEGSSLKAYTTYEYFLRRTPSLMATLHSTKSTEADLMFARLKSFSFTAIFPFYNHVDEILKSVRKMKHLRTLSLMLCPEPQSRVLEDEIEDAKGHLDVNDPWNEFDTAYMLVSHTVVALTVEGELHELRIDDVKMEGIRDNLETLISSKLQEWWSYEGRGIWRRKRQPTSEARPPTS